MSSFRDQLRALQAHPGVRAVVAAGRDGLLIDHAPDAELGAAEHLAALAPGLIAAAEMLADARANAAAGSSGGAGLRSVVVESDEGVIVALPVTPDVTVLAAIEAVHAGAAAAIGRVRAERGALAGSV